MKITRRQLRRIIKEAQWGNFTGGAAPLDEPPMDSGPMTPEMQQRVFDMLVDSGSDPQELKASGNYPDLMLDEADGSTEKYDDDSALRGGQSKLPDGLQKGIIDKTVEDREKAENEKKNEMKEVSARYLRNIIADALVNEDKSGVGKCPKSGCIEKRGDKWRIISNKTGKLWPQKYSTKEKAENALDAYHASRG